jgi:hypothetical protein
LKEKLKEKLIDYLEKWWAINKAKGLMAQLPFKRELKAGIFSETQKEILWRLLDSRAKKRGFLQIKDMLFCASNGIGKQAGR